MTHTSDASVTSAQPADMLKTFWRLPARLAAARDAARRWFRKVEAAHDSRRVHETCTAEVCRDTGIDPSDASGVASWQPDLPFFMQSGFGRK